MATNWKASLPKKRLSKRFKFNGGSQFLGNTGTGENNTVEPSKPTAMLNTGLGPRMVHEGEDLVKLANGDTQVIPANQSQLGQMEQRQGIPGMALGGRLRPPGGSPASGVVDVLNQTVNPTTSTDVGLNVGEPITNPTDQQTVTPLLPGQTEQNVALGLGAPVATGGASGGFQSFQPAGAQGGPPVPPTTDPLTPTGLTGIGDQAVAKGLGGLGAIAAGESPVDRTIANRTLGNLGAQQEAERMAAIQAQAQQGVTGPAAQAQQGMLGIAQGSQMGQTAGQLAIAAQERAGAAVRDMATVGLQKSQQDYDRQVDQVSALIQAGGAENLATAGEAFGSLYGVDLDTSRLSSAEGRVDFQNGMEDITKMVASGLDFEDALPLLQANGTLDALGIDAANAGDFYGQLALAGDPVYQAMNSLDDETLATMFPDMDATEARATIGKMHLMGIGTFDEGGKFQINTDMLSDLFGEGFAFGGGGGGGGDGPETPEERQTAYGDFSAVLKPEVMENMNQSTWENLGQPTAQEFETWYDSGGNQLMPLMVNPTAFEADFERIWRLTREHNLTLNPDERRTMSQQLSDVLTEIAPGMTPEDWARTGHWMQDTIAPLYEGITGFGTKGWQVAGDAIEPWMIEQGRFDDYGYSPDELSQFLADGKTVADVVPLNIYNEFAGQGWKEDQITTMWKYFMMGNGMGLWGNNTSAWGTNENVSGLEYALIGPDSVGGTQSE